jgi:hypothetical protein
VKRTALFVLPVERFPFFHEAWRKVNRDGHVEVNGAQYPVFAEHQARQVWARWDWYVVRILNHFFAQIAFHVNHTPGGLSTLHRDIPRNRRFGQPNFHHFSIDPLSSRSKIGL